MPAIRLALGSAFLLSQQPGCTKLVKQAKVTREGISLTYVAKEEPTLAAFQRVTVIAHDRRPNAAVAEDWGESGQKDETKGYLLLGVGGYLLYKYSARVVLGPGVDQEPTLREGEPVADLFRVALSERLRSNGATVIEDAGAPELTIELFVSQFSVSFSERRWHGVAGYSVRVRSRRQELCWKEVEKKSVKYNWYGFLTAQEALNEAFSDAIDAPDLVACVQRTGSEGRRQTRVAPREYAHVAAGLVGGDDVAVEVGHGSTSGRWCRSRRASLQPMNEILQFLIAHCSFLYESGRFKFVDSGTSTSFGGSGFLVLESDAIRLRFLRDRGQLLLDFQPGSRRGEHDWHSVDVVRKLVTGDPAVSGLLNEENAAFLRRHINEIEEKLSGPNAKDSVEKLHELERKRAKKLFG